ncbi:hypothetical protein SEMRO_1965_G308250.1 [Seminavis robusta]|uniref:Uncharacterized protein n=1 Tax=Seminavis robusta TaxID=568900 RepID=A0A9N8EU82_9STRA|nr:hypothetical protein SEMRO_1965_G308250.1 [Seminavis robusta]|eukprot:Sro1965_g308250.1 n/a (312) ;mRNA; r:2051-3061
MFQTLPVFSSDEFKQYKEAMSKALATSSSPLDASLEKVLPGVHSRLVASHNATMLLGQTLGAKVDQLSQIVVDGLAHLQHTTQATREETEKAVGFALVQTGRQLLGEEETAGGQFEETSPTAASVDDTDLDLEDVIEEVLATGQGNVAVEATPPRPPMPFGGTVPRVVGTHNSTPEDHRDYALTLKHSCLQDVHDEWFGSGKFADDAFGGIDGRNRLHGAKWRKHLDNGLFSYNKRLVEGVMYQSKLRKCQPDEVIREWEVLFEKQSFSVGNMVKYLQSQSLLKVGKPRGASLAKLKAKEKAQQQQANTSQ